MMRQTHTPLKVTRNTKLQDAQPSPVGGRMEELNRGYVQMLAEISSTKCNIDTDKESSSRFLGLV